MSYSSDYDARRSRRRIAGCGFALLVPFSFLVMAAAALMLGLLFGDCSPTQPDCHATSNRAFGWVMLGLLIFNIAVASLLGWWQSRDGNG